MSPLRHIRDPGPELAGDSVDAFLRNLGGPACLHLAGRDPHRCRVVVTLLHGNEPSGAIAVRRWLKAERQPAVDVILVIASVAAALSTPRFSQRMLPGVRDLNRCFRPPFEDPPGQLAKAILDVIAAARPEAVIDIHNTSGSGPAFGVCRRWDLQHEALVSLFTSRMVVASIDLGALMEISDERCPTVTIEAGGRQDEASNEVAWEGLQRFLTQEAVLACDAEAHWGIEVLSDSIRLELREGVALAYDEQPVADMDLTLRPDVERFNFGEVGPEDCLGWTKHTPEALFRAVDSSGRCALSRLVAVRDGQLYPACPLRLFMITTNPRIAAADCLFYAVRPSAA